MASFISSFLGCYFCVQVAKLWPFWDWVMWLTMYGIFGVFLVGTEHYHYRLCIKCVVMHTSLLNFQFLCKHLQLVLCFVKSLEPFHCRNKRQLSHIRVHQNRHLGSVIRLSSSDNDQWVGQRYRLIIEIACTLLPTCPMTVHSVPVTPLSTPASVPLGWPSQKHSNIDRCLRHCHYMSLMRRETQNTN